MNEKFLEQLKGIYIKLGGQEDLTAENSLIVILDKIYKQMGGEKEFKEFSVPEAIDLIEDEVGGGGGDSDFSTAEVTFINSGDAGSYKYTLMTIDNDEYALKKINVDDSVTVIVALYKGEVVLPLESFEDIDTSEMPTSTGGVEIDLINNLLTITGNGTFTAKSASHG